LSENEIWRSSEGVEKVDLTIILPKLETITKVKINFGEDFPKGF